MFRQHALFMVDFLSVTLGNRVHCPRMGLGVKIEDILIFFLITLFFFLMLSFVFKEQVMTIQGGLSLCDF